ncbi:hypothetical protein [Massilia sp. S19_KUP03_FR1]|uniref:hypothetical protein n=1 Tax=Massilia sp. S19_KUP03_FR1 TaxID=3025503 RepID=UPI002FCD6BAE
MAGALLSMALAMSACITAGASSDLPPVVVGLPSLIEHPSRFVSQPVCVLFYVGAPVASIINATSTGFNGAHLALGKTGEQVNCDGVSKAGRAVIAFQTRPGTWQPLWLALPDAAFPDASAGTNGKLLLLRHDLPPFEVAISIRREEYGTVWRAISWFFGIALPALVTAGLGLMVYRAQKFFDVRSGEQASLDRLRRDENGQLRKFFAETFKHIVALQDNHQFTSMMAHELTQSRILFDLPGRTRDPLLVALREADRERVKSLLKAAFPDFEQFII